MGPRSPCEPTYFLDENNDSADMARLLRAAGLRCVRIAEAGPGFRRGMLDVEWIPLIARRGWWGVTRDVRTLKASEELAAIRRHAAVHIVLRGKGLGIAALAEMLIGAHRALLVKIPKRTPPVIVLLRPGAAPAIEGPRRGGVERG